MFDWIGRPPSSFATACAPASAPEPYSTTELARIVSAFAAVPSAYPFTTNDFSTVAATPGLAEALRTSTVTPALSTPG